MNAQPNDETEAIPNWSGWLNASINGTYPLRRLLSGSEHGAVYLTECQGRADPNAAVKIIPIERVTLSQLSHWKSAAGLSHPHLVELLDGGLCQLGGHQFLFVVMEHAEQTLSEVLRQRALTPEEVTELLPATLNALTFLHASGFVHGHFKPQNVLVVNDQLKLSSDGILPVGAPRIGIAGPSVYDPPEATHTSFSFAGDVWGLGVTLVEALTQSLPRFDEQSGAARLPTSVPAALADTVQRCLSFNPVARPSASDLDTQFANAPAAPAAAVAPEAPAAPDPPAAPIASTAPIAPVSEPAVREVPAVSAMPKRQVPMARAMATVSVLLLAIIWAGWHFSHTRPKDVAAQPVAVVPDVGAQLPPSPVPVPATAAQSVIHVQVPDVPRKSLGTIRGHFRIVLLVVVDHSGTVIRELVKSAGPSSYFARLTKEAAKRSTFTATDGSGTHEWLLRFEFTRSSVTAEATPHP